MVYLRDLPIYKNNSKKEPENNSWDIGPDIIGNIPVIGPLFRSAAVTATDTTGLALKGLGAELKGIADSSDKSNNPDMGSSLYRGIGNFLNDAGTWLEGTTQTPKYEQYRPSEEWQNKDLSDILSNSDTFSNYVTDPRGLRAELGGGLGSMLSFLALARLFPQAFATNAVKAPLDFTSNLLGRAGLDKAAQIVSGNAAKEFAGTGLQFATTMGPAGALVNAATIIDPLKEQGLSDSEIAGRMNELIAEELPADMAFAGLTGNVLKGQLGKFIAPRNSSSWRKALANAAGVPIEGLGGYYSNVNQAILSEKYSGQPYGELFGEHTPYEESAGRMGALAGIPSAAYGGIRGYREAQAQDIADRDRVDNERLAEFNRRNTESKVRQATRDAIADTAPYRAWARDKTANQMSDEAFNLIVQAANKYGVPVDRALATAFAESEGNPDAISPAGAIGIMQLMPKTAAGLGVDPRNLAQNIDGGVRYLKQMYDKTGDWTLAHAAYNAGLGNVQDAGGVPNFKETQNYVARIDGYLRDVDNTGYSNQKNNNQPQVDIVSGLQSAKKSLDGKQMDNGTVGCVEAVTKILSHVHPEFKKMVDDGVVNTVEGENSLYSRLEKMGVEIIPFDESQVSQGDIIFYDGDQTFAHVLVADHIDEQGNWRVFGNSSSNNKVMEQPLYQGQTPSRIAKVSSFGDNTIQGRAEQLLNERNSPPEPAKPLFDINAEDTTTPKLIEQFLTDKATTALSQNDAPTLEFINPLLNGNNFQDTPENRQAVLGRYGDELINYIQSNSQSEQPTQPQTPKTQTSPTQQSVQPKDKNQAIVQEGRRFLEELHQSNDQSKAQVAFQLQNALNKGNHAEVEKILNDNGRTIQQPQPAQPAQPTQPTQSQQQQPVSKNKPPQNILAQSESPKTISGNDKLIRQASKAVTPKTSREGKKRIGNAITRLANQNGIAIPDVDYTSLQNGSSKKITEWQNKLAQAGVFNSTQPTQAQQDNTPTLSERIGQALDEYNKKTRLDNWEAVKDNMQLRRPSLKNIDRRIEHGKPNTADISKRENWSDIPDWRGRTREDNLALRLQRQNDLKASQQRRISERMQKLATNETPADVIGQDNPEVETYTTQSLQEIQAEQQRQQQEQERQKELRRKYSDIDSNENQTGHPARQINENIINPDEMIGGNIAQRIRDDEDARTRKISDRYIAEPNEGANTGQGKNLNPDEMIGGNIAQRIRDDEDAKTRKISDRYIAEPNEGANTGQGKNLNPDEMIGNIAQTFARQKQPKPQKSNQPEEIQPVKKESPQPKKPRSKAVYGHDTEVISDSRTPYKVKYKVVEADDLTTSHGIENGNIFRNNKYPAELQPRQRERSNMQAGLISMAGNLNPKDLVESRNGNQGAPVVRNDGVVLNGNGRAAAISYAYKNGTTNGYKESLIQNAEKLGLNAEDISKMNQPVLVRELAEELTPEKISDLTTSQTGGSRMGATEQAQADAKKLSSGTLARMSQPEDIDFTSNEGAEVTRAALNDIVTDSSELNALTTDDGRISQDGINRVKRALFAKAYGDNSVLARMSESTDDNVRGITNALLSAAPSIANVQEHIENGTLHKYDLSSIVSAVKKLSDLRERGTPVSNYLQEQSLFAEHADSEETREILDTFDKNKRSSKKLASFLKNIATKIQNQGDPRQETLFGKNEKIPLINLIRQAREAAENDRNIPLFSKRGSDVDTRIDNFVEGKDLTPQQQLLKSFGKTLGVKTIFFRNADGKFHGAHSGNTTYINVNSEMPLSKVFWHESLHWLKANNPELYKALVKAAGITTAQRQAYLEKTGRTDIKAPDEINEEILADQFEDAAKRTGLFQSVAGKNRGLIQRVVQWLKDTMNKFIDHFRNPDGKLTTKQAQAFADEFGRIANQLKDQNGNKIFRYNRRTRNIELADGRKVEDFSFDEKETRENIARAEREGTLKYSVGNNNNSNESLWHKAKNAMSSFFGFNTPEKRRRKIITDNLRRLNGYRILYGYVDGADDVVIDNLQKLIKSRNAYDWEKLLPVVSEGIAKNLRLNPTQAQSNYIADWLTTGALNNTTSPEAKAFEKAMQDNPAMGEILLETRKIFEELANMDAWDSVKSTIAHRQNKTFWEKIKFFKDNFTEEVLDDLQPLQNIVDTAIKQAPPAVAEMIKRGVNVKQLAQIARGRGATANRMINGNADEIAKVRSELAAQYVGCYFDDFKTMKMIIESVDGDWKGLEAFALAKLSKEMYEKNRTLSPKEEPYTPYMTEERANHIIQTGEAKFGEAQKDLVRFSKILAAMEYDAGVITNATFARYMKGWKEYIPTPRVWDENEDYNEIDFMKAKRGHTDDTWSPVQTIMANTYKIIQACERNKVKLELATLIRFGGFESNLSEVPTGNPDADNIIRFKENGKTKYLETPDPAIKRAIEAMHDKSESNWLMKMLRATSGFMRAAYTMANPDFAAGNILRDLPDAFIHNKQLGRTAPIIDMLKAFFSAAKSIWTNDADFIEWQMNGGAQASFVSEDVDYIQRSINDATTTRKQRYLSRHFASQLLDDFQRLSEFTENITRVASYKMAKNSLAKAGVKGVTGKQLAALAAREASIDFSKAGRATRTLNKGVLFANAAVQGINQWIEAGREWAKGNRTPLFGKVFRAFAAGFLPAIAQALFAGADDDRKKEYEQAPDWEKDVYWIFGSIRIPKGMDFGLRLIANITDELFSSKPFDWKRAFGSPVWNALPSLTATIITPTVEVLQNHSYFRGAPIDPKSEQHLPAYLRGDANTSDFSKWLGGTSVAKFFSDGTGWSPRKLDYLINGYLGFMGRTLAHSGNYLERGIGYDEIPIIRRFVFTPYKNPKIVKEFYEAYDKQEQLYNEYKLTKERPDGYDPALHKRFKAAYEQMHKISKRETTLLNTPDMNHDKRKAKLQELEKRRVALAERVFQGAR